MHWKLMHLMAARLMEVDRKVALAPMEVLALTWHLDVFSYATKGRQIHEDRASSKGVRGYSGESYHLPKPFLEEQAPHQC